MQKLHRMPNVIAGRQAFVVIVVIRRSSKDDAILITAESGAHQY